MAKKAEIPDFYLTGVDGKQTQTSELSPIDEFVGSLGTNTPKPVDITPQVQDIFAPQSQPQTSTGQFLDTLDPGRAQRREEEGNQAAIRDFMQTGGVSQPGAAPQPGEPTRTGSTIPSRDATGIPSAPQQGQRIDIGSQVADIADAMGLTGSQKEKFIREQTQSSISKEAKAGIASKRLIKSIAEETGKTREEIGKEIGWTEGSGMSKIKALAGLKNLQKKNEIARADTGERASARERAISSASFGEGAEGERIPENEEARAVLAYERMDDLGPDPQSEEPLYKSMTDAQKNQADRYTKKLSKGFKVAPGEEKRFNAMLEKVEKGAERKYLKKLADREENALTLAAKRAQTAGDNAQRQLMRDRIQGWKTELETIDDAYKKAKRDEKKRLDERRSEIFGNIEAFNKGMEGGAQTGAEAGTTQGQPDQSGFVAGNTYTDANGNRATYLGDGKWENK